MIAAGNDNLWAKFCSVIEMEDLKDDERFKTNPLRNDNYYALRPKIAEVISEKSTKDWYDALTEGGVPCGTINDVGMVVEDEHVRARNMIQNVSHPIAGEVKVPGIPIKVEGCSDEIRFPAPVFG